MPPWLFTPLCWWLAIRDYRAASRETTPLRSRLLAWRARGWMLSSAGFLTMMLLPMIALAVRPRTGPLNGLDMFGLGLMPLGAGFSIVGVAWMGLVIQQRSPGLVANADRNVFPRRSGGSGA